MANSVQNECSFDVSVSSTWRISFDTTKFTPAFLQKLAHNGPDVTTLQAHARKIALDIAKYGYPDDNRIMPYGDLSAAGISIEFCEGRRSVSVNEEHHGKNC